MSFASVTFLCHSLLSSSFGLLNLSFTIFSCHCILLFSSNILYSVITGSYRWVLPLGPTVMCFCHLHLAFEISICDLFTIDVSIRFCHVVLLCASVVSSVVLRSFSSVIVFCNVVLPCSCVIFFCRLHLAFCKCHLHSCGVLDIFDMGEEGHG